MLLQYADGKPFAIGATPYQYRPASEREKTLRITIEIQIGNVQANAFVDTGGVYLICPAALVRPLGLHQEDALGHEQVLLRGITVTGALHRLDVTILAAYGEDLTFAATALVVADEHLDWSGFPCILGMQGCMERLCFAVDPITETLYFG
jgi:hypothetical protein